MEECATQSPLPLIGMKILKKKRAMQSPMPLIGMMNPQNTGHTGNSPALGIARDFPKAGIKALRWP